MTVERATVESGGAHRMCTMIVGEERFEQAEPLEHATHDVGGTHIEFRLEMWSSQDGCNPAAISLCMSVTLKERMKNKKN